MLNMYISSGYGSNKMQKPLPNFKKIREDAGYTQNELAQQAGVSLSTISRLESQGPLAIQRRLMVKVCKALGVDIAVIDAVREEEA